MFIVRAGTLLFLASTVLVFSQQKKVAPTHTFSANSRVTWVERRMDGSISRRGDLAWRPGVGIFDGNSTGCHFVPAFRTGQVIGLKVFAPPGSRLEDLGFVNWDIIRTAGGLSLASYEGYRSLVEARSVTLELEDAVGQSRTIQYSFHP